MPPKVSKPTRLTSPQVSKPKGVATKRKRTTRSQAVKNLLIKAKLARETRARFQNIQPLPLTIEPTVEADAHNEPTTSSHRQTKIDQNRPISEERMPSTSAQEEDDFPDLSEHFPDVEDLPELLVEPATDVVSTSDVVPGRRIVNMSHVLDQLYSLAEHPIRCTTGRFTVASERRSGLMCYFTYKCNTCGEVRTITTEKESMAEEVNDMLVWGAMAVGMGHHQTTGMLGYLEVPAPAKDKWDRHEEKIGDVWEKQLNTYLKAHGAKEKAIAVRKGNVEDGVPYIAVIVDGGWSKRSYGHNYNASSGMACIIGAETKELLYLGVCNKYCYMCSIQSPGATPKKHKCYKNFSGPSTSMEQSVLVQGFRQSEAMHGIRYKFLVGDGDSSVFTRQITILIGSNCAHLGHLQNTEITRYDLINPN